VADPHRVAFVLTHPVQYFAPWFRFIHANVREIDLRVLYAIQPSAAVQGAGFGTEFQWDQPLLDGYNSRVLPPHRAQNARRRPVRGASDDQSVSGEAYTGLDAPALDTELIDERTDFVVIPGWHAAVYRRAMRICRRHRIPALYRGDSNLSSGPVSPLRRAAWRMRTRARLREYAAFLSVGVRSREYLEAFGAPEPLIFDSPHAVDNQHFARAHTSVDRRALRQQFGLAPDRFTALFVGKLEPKKRPLDAIRAIRLLPSAQLLVVGSGPLDEACRAASAEAGGRVVFAGFLNQSALGAAYRAADCLVLPSDGRETWGLVVNEALAAGVPVVVSDRVGCRPDLVVEGETGGVFRFGDADALTAALGHVQDRLANGHDFAPRCRGQAEQHDFAAASKGLVDACETLGCQARAAAANRGRRTQVLALCGHMVSPGGLERQTFEVLGTLRRSGAGVHALLNGWSSSRIVRLAERAGVAWSIARSDEELTRRSVSPAGIAGMLWEIAVASGNVMAAAWRHGTTDVLVPDFLMTIRAWPALVLLRASGRRIVLRVGMAPPQGRFYKRLWRTLVNSAVDRLVANSEFLLGEVRAVGIAERKLGLIRNAAVPRGESLGRAANARVVYVGQIIPDKGVDLLIDAIAVLRRDGLPVTLDVVGEMNGWESPSYTGYRDHVRRRAAQAWLNGSVRFLGYQENVGSFLAEASVHCVPSRAAFREGMTNVVLEAKAAGLPSVVTRTGSLPELVEHQVDGWIAEEQPHAIADGLRYFLEDDARRARAGAAAHGSLQRFSRETFDAAWLKEFGVQ
jgi:glycosyltransferase involved in cell wall biosynthesis